MLSRLASRSLEGFLEIESWVDSGAFAASGGEVVGEEPEQKKSRRITCKSPPSAASDSAASAPKPILKRPAGAVGEEPEQKPASAASDSAASAPKPILKKPAWGTTNTKVNSLKSTPQALAECSSRFPWGTRSQLRQGLHVHFGEPAEPR